MDNKPSSKNSIPSRVELNKKSRKKSHPLLWIITIIILAIAGAASYGGYVYFKAKQAVDQTYDPKNAVKQDNFDGKKSFAILLLGTDTGALGRTAVRGNTDTMIIAVVNPKNKSFNLMSIPRDTMAEMIGTDNFSVHKINAAYNIGGAKMALNTTSTLLNVPLKYYIEVNMGGLEKLVDGVGGVDVNNTFKFSYGGYTFNKGKLHLNGKQALAYSRMRYDDPRGDYGRQVRQRQVIMSILKNSMSLNTLKNLDQVLNSASKNIRTNLTFDSMTKIAQNYRDCTNNMTSDYLHGRGAMIGDASYQVMSNSELQRCSNIVRKNLGLSTVNLNNNETYQNSKNTDFDWNSGDSNQKYYVYEPNSNNWWNGDNLES
ncbi:LCP family protein required for cell wall assembly [Lactobacillus colini]|uniref:LCP family protein required for cell wall assembly n=1 Tax=Lactobacillus colini TaxID=1819254 RepID=A0ABS4MCI4_9LACO|nr:LCP family protein [Lactobacillus colini]MBP2057397.1 LCP family protein required for cell wall assembly [Lactobacillus colini]